MYAGVVTFLISAACLIMMRVPKSAAQGITAENKSIFGVFGELADGFRYILQHKKTMQIIGLMLLFWSCGTVVVNGLTGIVNVHYNLGLQWHGYFMAVLGVGMVLGAASCSLARRGIPKEVGIAWAMLLVGIFLGLFSVVTHPWIGLAFLTMGAFFGAVLLVSLDTLLQRIVPNYVRGRVMGVKDLVSMAGLVSAAIPLAFWTGIDDHIRLVLTGMSCVVVLAGIALIATYYRSQYLPVSLSIAVRFVRGYLMFFKGFEWGNAARIPIKGPVIFVANHSTAYDPFLMQAASKHRMIQFMMAKEYYEIKWLKWFFKWMRVIPVNRTGNDTSSIRTAIRALKDGACIGLYPEGKISTDGRMNPGRPGVALLALMSGATVVPAYIRATKPHQGMAKDFLSTDKVTIFFGRPIRFDDLKGHGEEARTQATERIISAIKALRERYETDPFRRTDAEVKEVEKAEGTGVEPALG
jgi:1-acyl-sn-glycerol-3-phosphate acyltransferase